MFRVRLRVPDHSIAIFVFFSHIHTLTPLRGDEMRFFLLFVIVAVSFEALSQDPEIAVGQVWSYEARQGEEQSRLTILKIETLHDQRIVHIAVADVFLERTNAPESVVTYMGHLPFEESALKNSLRNMVGIVPQLPEYEDGYALWREAFDSGRGGVFTISVAESVAYMEQVINQ